MVLLYSTFPSSCSSSPSAGLECESQQRLRQPSDTFFSAPSLPSDNDYSSYRCRAEPIQFRLDELGADMDSEDDDCSESSSVSSDGASSFDSRSICSIPNELDSLNERRREMLQLSISKIQTMNASNVPVSLRKSLLIYNTMKSLQRDLSDCGEDVYGSLIEGSGASADDDMLEEEDCDSGNWAREQDQGTATLFCEQPTDRWTWGNSDLTANDSRNDAIQDLDLCGDVFTPLERSAAGNGNPSYWSNNGASFIDDYLGMWGAWDNDDYNPLTNCNLSQSEILHMFGAPAHHVSSQLLSQA